VARISIASYVHRICKHSSCSYETMVACLVYLDRLLKCSEIVVDFNSIHRLLITGVMLASKFMDDKHRNNKRFADVGGISVRELNKMEQEMIFAIDFNLVISPAEFNTYVDVIIEFSGS
jgi:hypothetical protein